jgi:hypothetical protein
MRYNIMDAPRNDVSDKLLECTQKIQEIIADYGITAAIVGLAIERHDGHADCESMTGMVGPEDMLDQLTALVLDTFNQRIGEST